MNFIKLGKLILLDVQKHPNICKKYELNYQNKSLATKLGKVSFKQKQQHRQKQIFRRLMFPSTNLVNV